MKNLIILLSILLFSISSYSQTTVIFKPNGEIGKDAEIADSAPNTNLDDDKLSPYAWTIGGVPRVHRCLIEFMELNTLPANAVIQSAKLSLFFKTNHPYPPTDHAGANDLYLRRITAPWTEQGVTWANQPSTTSANEVLVAPSSIPTQDYTNIDITNMVIDMLTSNNYGFMIQLQNESPLRQVMLASSDHATSTLHPELKITYTSTFPAKLNQTFRSDLFDLYPNPIKNNLYIKLKNQSSDYSLKVLNFMGQSVFSTPITTQLTTLNFKNLNLSKGTYFIRVGQNENYSTAQVIFE